MLTGLDHVIIAVADPDAAATELSNLLGLQVAEGGRHEAHGTFNRIVWLGDSYLELMGAFDPALAAESWWGAHILGILERSQAGIAGIPMASDAVIADVARLRQQGSTIEDATEGQRVRDDGDVVRWQMARLPLADPELGLQFLIEHDTTGAEWRPTDRDGRARFEHPGPGRVRLVHVEFPVADIARASLRLLRELGIQFRPSLAGRGARDASIGSQTLRLVPAVGNGTGTLPTVALRATDIAERSEARLFGCTWLVEPGRI